VTIDAGPTPEILLSVAPAAAKIALTNVLHNAVKFSPAGGLVTLVVTAHRDQAVVAVTDSGPGVAPDDLPRLFQRFYRGHASRATGTPGIGLGLAIARALVERENGWIAVERSADKGAIFSVHLPRA
jgi:signal transduction histidine kinase